MCGWYLCLFHFEIAKQGTSSCAQKLCDLYLRQNGARNYYGMKGLIEIDLLDPLIITV
jgi:hypothetical protein